MTKNKTSKNSDFALEDASGGSTSAGSVASVAMPISSIHRRESKKLINSIDQSDSGQQESSKSKNDPCWKGYKKIGNKIKSGKSVPNCVKAESVDLYTASLQENLNSKLMPAVHYSSEMRLIRERICALKQKLPLHVTESCASAVANKLKAKVTTTSLSEDEGDPEGEETLSIEMLTHIVEQIKSEGVHALVKSLEWGDGAAEELLQLIVIDLKKHLANKEIDVVDQQLSEKMPKGAGVNYYINDFAKSNAAQFKDKSAEKKRRMAIAAYYASKQKQ